MHGNSKFAHYKTQNGLTIKLAMPVPVALAFCWLLSSLFFFTGAKLPSDVSLTGACLSPGVLPVRRMLGYDVATFVRTPDPNVATFVRTPDPDVVPVGDLFCLIVRLGRACPAY